MLVAAGARVEHGKRVFIPAIVVEETIRTAPYSVTIYNRQGQPAMLLEENNVYYGTGSDCPNLLDSVTGERRPFLYKDVEESIRLVDALPNIDFTMSNGLAADIDQDTQYQHKYALMLRNTTKPQVVTAGDKASLIDIVDMAACVAGGREALGAKNRSLCCTMSRLRRLCIPEKPWINCCLWPSMPCRSTIRRDDGRRDRPGDDCRSHCPGQCGNFNRIGAAPT